MTAPSGECFCELLFLELETKSVNSQSSCFSLKVGILDILPPSRGKAQRKASYNNVLRKTAISCHVGNVSCYVLFLDF
jgi:hypothetical protein